MAERSPSPDASTRSGGADRAASRRRPTRDHGRARHGRRRTVRAKSFRLAGGEALVVDLVPDDAELEPEGPPVPVRYRDDDLLVIAKPPGLVTHPTENRRTGTLVNRLLGMGEPLSTTGWSAATRHRAPARRRDLAASWWWRAPIEAHEALAAMLKDHAIERRYLALVRGEVEHDEFAVDAPLGRRADKVVVDHTEGRAAETGFEVRERFDGAHAPRGDPEDRPHPPDPRASAGDRPPDRRRQGLRRWGRRGQATRPAASLPALVEDRVRPAAERGSGSNWRSPFPRTSRPRCGSPGRRRSSEHEAPPRLPAEAPDLHP